MRAKMLWAGIAVAIGLSLSAVLATATILRFSEQSKPARSIAEVGNAPAKGPGDAPVTIIEFSDFECPFCQRFRAETLGQIERQYAGRVRFAYKQFPLRELHPQALNAALASSCAYFLGKEDLFFQYHDILFERADEWKGDETKFASYARDLGLDERQFEGCLKSDGAIRWVNKDVEDGKKWGVERVPTVFVNGQKIVGAQPFEFYVKVIEQELKR